MDTEYLKTVHHCVPMRVNIYHGFKDRSQRFFQRRLDSVDVGGQ